VYLERAFQTYAYQSVQPADRVLLDYGSAAAFSRQYRELCQRYRWGWVRVEPVQPRWYLAAAYNAAVAALAPAVDTVFKSDSDVLLGPTVLATAARWAGAAFCQFPYFTTGSDVRYPPWLDTPEDFLAVLRQCPRPVPSVGQGLAAFPRLWFEAIGGFDLAYQTWGYEDHDLRFRAELSIAVREIDPREAVLVHQWHPPSPEASGSAANRAYLKQMCRAGPLVRNGGCLLREQILRLPPASTDGRLVAGQSAPGAKDPSSHQASF
jgi:hypothetical protein